MVLPALGGGTLWDNSETTYAEVAREVLLSGDPIVMHLNAVPWFVQPPFYFWVAALFAKLFGVNAFALRLPSAIATIGMGIAVAVCGARVVNLRVALLGSVILSTSLMQAVIGRLAIMDALLNLTVTLAILGAFAALLRGHIRWWYVAWVSAAVGVLTKGPVALVIPLMVVGSWSIWERRWGDGLVAAPSRRAWVIGTVSFVVIVGSWMLLVLHASGWVALRELLGHYTVGRYTGTIENQSGPLWYYIPVVVLGFFPWTAFLAPSLAWALRMANPGVSVSRGPLVRLCLAWSIVPFVFFSFAQTKLPNYVALELPALAILTALWFDERIEHQDRRKAPLGWAALVPLSIGVMGIAIVIFSQNNRLGAGLNVLFGDLLWLGGIVLIGSIACLCLLAIRRAAFFAPLALAAANLCAMLLIAMVLEPHAERFKPIPKLAAVIENQRRSGDTVAILGVAGASGLIFYTQPPVLEITARDPLDLEHAWRAALCTKGRVFVVSSSAHLQRLPSYGRERREVASEGFDILLLYDGPFALSPADRALGRLGPRRY